MSLSVAQREPAFRTFIPARTISAEPGCTPATLGDHLTALRVFGACQRHRRNETIFQEGDAVQNLYRVVEGTIRLCRHTQDGRRHIADFALPGDLVGTLGAGVQAFTAEPVTDVTLIAYSRLQLDRLAESDPRVRSHVLSHLAASLVAAQRHTFVLGCQSAKERLASFIVRMAERSGGGARLDLPMGRQDIADHLGLTIETICRAIAALKSEGVIAVPSAHQMILRDMAALHDMAGGVTEH